MGNERNHNGGTYPHHQTAHAEHHSEDIHVIGHRIVRKSRIFWRLVPEMKEEHSLVGAGRGSMDPPAQVGNNAISYTTVFGLGDDCVKAMADSDYRTTYPNGIHEKRPNWLIVIIKPLNNNHLPNDFISSPWIVAVIRNDHSTVQRRRFYPADCNWKTDR